MALSAVAEKHVRIAKCASDKELEDNKIHKKSKGDRILISSSKKGCADDLTQPLWERAADVRGFLARVCSNVVNVYSGTEFEKYWLSGCRQPVICCSFRTVSSRNNSSASLMNFFTSCVPLAPCAKYTQRRRPPSARDFHCGSTLKNTSPPGLTSWAQAWTTDCRMGTCSAYFHTGDDVVLLGVFLPHVPQPSFHRARTHLVPLSSACRFSDLQRLKAHIQPGDGCAFARHALRQNTAAAADVRHLYKQGRLSAR